jgi:hypothetical protein
MLGPGGSVTGADGAFTLRGLTRGDWYVSAGGPEGSGYPHAYWTLSGSTPDIDKAVLIHLPGTDTMPRTGFKTGRTLGATRVPIRVSWPPAGVHATAYRLQEQVAGGAWSTVDTLPGTSLEGTVVPSSTTRRYRVVARYEDGISTLWGTGPSIRVVLGQQGTSAAWRGAWGTRRSSAASGGSYRVTSDRGASTTYRFTGRSFAWVALTGPGYGRASVSVDGGKPVVVDLHRSSTTWRRIVFATSWSTSAAHRVRIECLGTARHPRIAVDGFLTVR